jgi:hypothetical protein
MGNKLDLKQALELCRKSGAEDWKVAGFDDDAVGIKGPSGFNEFGRVDGQIVVIGEDAGVFIGESGAICKAAIIYALEAKKLLKDVQYSYAMNKTNSGAVFIGDELERRINKFLMEDSDGT